MKNFSLNFKKTAAIIGVMCLPAMLLSSCLKDNNNNTTSNQPQAILAVVDASPDAPSMDFYLGTSQINAYAVIYGGGINYFRATAGIPLQAIFYTTGTTTKEAADTLTLTANVNYTLFLANSITKPDFLLTTDTLVSPADNYASMRFVDLSPNAPAVDLVVRHGATIATNLSYKHHSAFTPVVIAQNDTLDVRQAGTTTVLATIPRVSLQNKTVYTVWLQGINGSTSGLSAGAMLNAQYN